MKKVIVFDMDKTLGYFTQLGVLIEAIEEIRKKSIKRTDLYKIFDLYPECFRPGIFKTLKYIKKNKKKENIKLLIYTNNIGPKKWAYDIKNYLEYKIGKNLFDKVITAWKVEGKVYEKCRTTHYKIYKDLLMCGKLDKKDKILFFDDTFFEDLAANQQVTFIYNSAYKLDLDFKTMHKRFLKSKLKHLLKYRLIHKLLDVLNDSGYKPSKRNCEYKANEFLDKVKLFILKNKTKKTRKRRRRRNNKSKKK